MKKLFLTIPAIMVLLLISTDFSIAKSTDIPIYTELDPEGTPPSFMLNVPQRPSAAGYCYIEALSMQIAYFRPDISAAKVFAYAMFGAGVYWTDYTNVLLSGKMFTTGHTLSVTQGLGIPYILGAGSEKGYAKDMYKQASGKLFFENGQQALKYLKAAIADGRPVQVHLDMGYLEVNGVNCDPKFNKFSPGSSHLMVVVGYDKNNVYFNETISEDMDPEDNEFREFPVPIPVFLESWKRAEEINKGTELQSGPYWMMFFAKKDVSAITEKKTTGEEVKTKS